MKLSEKNLLIALFDTGSLLNTNSNRDFEQTTKASLGHLQF